VSRVAVIFRSSMRGVRALVIVSIVVKVLRRRSPAWFFALSSPQRIRNIAPSTFDYKVAARPLNENRATAP